MADNKLTPEQLDNNVTLQQLAMQMAEVDKRCDALALGKANKVSPISISIPVSAWTDNTDAETLAAGFMFRADVPVEGLTEADSVDTFFDFRSRPLTRDCGMDANTYAGDNLVYYISVEKPAADLAATLRVFQAKRQGGGT